MDRVNLTGRDVLLPLTRSGGSREPWFECMLGSQPLSSELSLPSGSRLPDNRRPCSASLAAFTTISPSPPAEVSGMVPAGKPRYGPSGLMSPFPVFGIPPSSRVGAEPVDPIANHGRRGQEKAARVSRAGDSFSTASRAAHGPCLVEVMLLVIADCQVAVRNSVKLETLDRVPSSP